jgi:hypothetical protein
VLHNFTLMAELMKDNPPAPQDMYDAEWFFVPSSINRYSVSARQNLKTNPDGSIDLYIQKDSPGSDKESNWLPAPSGRFILCMRLYWPTEPPKTSLLQLTWRPPFIQRTAA